MIGILHGYLLEGSGSNLWTRSIIQALCKQGETVHLFCQENHPEKYDFISEAYIYDQNKIVTSILNRERKYKGKCIMHKPKLGETLPVYVWDHYEEFKNVKPMIELSDEEIENYLAVNINIISKIVYKNHIKVLHANHAVLMSVVAQRISETLNIPFAIMPHGSAIEYAVKKDERFFNYAKNAFDSARKIFVIGPEIQQRVKTLFSSVPNIENKMEQLNLGADTDLFEVIEKNDRIKNIDRLNKNLKDLSRGKSEILTHQLLSQISENSDKSELLRIIQDNSNYEVKCPDENVETKLNMIDWQNEKIILFMLYG